MTAWQTAFAIIGALFTIFIAAGFVCCAIIWFIAEMLDDDPTNRFR